MPPQRAASGEHPRADPSCLWPRQVRFLTEGTYLDHGDNPYNLGFKASMLPASDLLIDDATYTAWFGPSLDNNDTNCGNGRRAMELTP
jgi:hypothetical protein